MKTPVLYPASWGLLALMLSPAAANAFPSPADSAHFCQVIDPEEWERDQPLPAAKRTALNAGESRMVRLFYFLPNDRTYRPHVVEAMKTGILEVQSFYREQMAAHGYGNKTFQIETDAQGVPVVHRVNGDRSDSHYKNRGRPENEISRAFDTSSIVQLIVMDISRSSGGIGVGLKQRGMGIVYGGWTWSTAAHELGHGFGLQHDFRDDAYIMSYGDHQNSLSECAANFLSVNPYFNQSIPLAAGNHPSIKFSRSPDYTTPITLDEFSYHRANYLYGKESLQIRVRVRDPNGLHQVFLFAKTGEGLLRATGFSEVLDCRKLSGETDMTVTFNYDGKIPTDDAPNLLSRIRHEVFVLAVDKQGNRNDHPYEITLYATGIREAKVPLRDRSRRAADSIYNVVRLFHDRHVSRYEHITDAHLADIGTMFVNNIDTNNRLRSDDFDGLTGLGSLELRIESGYSESTPLPAGFLKDSLL